MPGSVRQYLAVLIVGVVAGLGTFGLLILTRLLQPASTFVRRGLMPRPLAWLTRWARSRTLRFWSPDPEISALVLNHLAGPFGARLRRLGVSPAEAPVQADVVVVGPGATVGVDDLSDVPQPCALLRLDDPADARAVLVAFKDLALRIRVGVLDPVDPADADAASRAATSSDVSHGEDQLT